MSSYEPVQTALNAGADPSMLCATCPWDRMCVIPPSMTKAEIDAKIEEASAKDEQRHAQARLAGTDAGLPVGTLMTAMMFAGKDTSARVCPVFALRLRSSGGRQIADTLKASMQQWDDQE